jgi:hypothetical protein
MYDAGALVFQIRIRYFFKLQSNSVPHPPDHFKPWGWLSGRSFCWDISTDLDRYHGIAQFGFQHLPLPMTNSAQNQLVDTLSFSGFRQ